MHGLARLVSPKLAAVRPHNPTRLLRSMLPLMLSIAAQAEPVISGKLTFTITDHSGLPPLVVVEAGNRAGLLLSRAGVQTKSRLCSKDSERAGSQHRPCAETGPLTVAIRIIDAKSELAGHKADICGFALTDRGGKPGRLAIVNADCVKRVSPPGQKAFIAVLGHIFAHEIGHLLLGPDSHSPEGLMSPLLTKSQKILLLQNQLHFKKEESARMLDALRLRAAALEVAKYPDSEPAGGLSASLRVPDGPPDPQ